MVALGMNPRLTGPSVVFGSRPSGPRASATLGPTREEDNRLRSDQEESASALFAGSLRGKKNKGKLALWTIIEPRMSVFRFVRMPMGVCVSGFLFIISRRKRIGARRCEGL